MKTALVTGAARRVGRSISESLADAGFDLILHANESVTDLDELAKILESTGVRVRTIRADLSVSGQATELADWVRANCPVVDLLVNNAAVYECRCYEDISRSDYDRMLEINLHAPFFLTQQLLPCLRGATAPSVVMISDIVGAQAAPGFAHYTISKAGMNALTKALAVELAPKIRVNAVAPGIVAAPPRMSQIELDRALTRVPLGAQGSPTAVAETVRFLATQSYTTGQVFHVDGGRSALL